MSKAILDHLGVVSVIVSWPLANVSASSNSRQGTRRTGGLCLDCFQLFLETVDLSLKLLLGLCKLA